MKINLNHIIRNTTLIGILCTLIGCSGLTKVKNEYQTIANDSLFTKMISMKNREGQFFELHQSARTEFGYTGTINLNAPKKNIPRKAHIVVFYTDSLPYKAVNPEWVEINLHNHQIYRTIHTEYSPWASTKRNSTLFFTVLSLSLCAASYAGAL